MLLKLNDKQSKEIDSPIEYNLIPYNRGREAAFVSEFLSRSDRDRRARINYIRRREA